MLKATVSKHAMLIMRLDGYTYQEIANKAGVSRQRVQQLLSPPQVIRNIAYKRASGRCQSCGVLVGKSGHVHHMGSNGGEEDYNDVDNLQLLCLSCHRKIHVTPVRANEQKMCPDCGSKHVWKKGLGRIPKAPRHRYVCVDCGCTFYVWDR